MLCLNLSACPASRRLHVARPVPAAWTSLPTRPRPLRLNSPGCCPSSALSSASSSLSACNSPVTPQSPGGKSRQPSHSVSPQELPPLPWDECSSSLLSLHPFPWQPERNLAYLQVRRSGLPTSHLPQLSWPKDMATVSCSLQGPLLSPHALSCLYALHLLFPLPGILFSATISLTNCYLSWTQLSPSRNLPYSWVPCPSCPEATHAC